MKSEASPPFTISGTPPLKIPLTLTPPAEALQKVAQRVAAQRVAAGRAEKAQISAGQIHSVQSRLQRQNGQRQKGQRQNGQPEARTEESQAVPWLPLLLVTVLVISVYVGTIGALPLVGRDEPRYAQVAREMFLRHDIVTPTLGGRTWFEKPALLYWLMMAAYELFGISEWSARLGAALCGLATIPVLFFLTRRVSFAQAQWSALALASSGGMLAFSHGATFDIPLTLAVALSLAGFFVSQSQSLPQDLTRSQDQDHAQDQDRSQNHAQDQDHSLPWMSQSSRGLALFWGGIGLGLLAKGLVGIVLPLGVVLVYGLLRGERRVWRLGWAWGAPLALLVASVWYAPVIARHGWPFINEFFVKHHFMRYTSDRYHHAQPFYYYGPILLLLALPWTPVLLVALARLRPAAWRGDDDAARLRALALAWLCVPIAFFSLSGSKLPGYILPALPGAMLLVGEVITQWANGTRAQVVRRLSWGTALLLLAGTALLTTTRIGIARAEKKSVRSLMETATQRGWGVLPVGHFRVLAYATTFYASGRLLYGTDGEPLQWDSPEAVRNFAIRRGRVLVVARPRDMSLLRDAFALRPAPLMRLEKVGDNGEFALLLITASAPTASAFDARTHSIDARTHSM